MHALTCITASALDRLGHEVINNEFFDTLTIGLEGVAGDVLHEEAVRQRIDLRRIYGDYVGITFDESTTFEDVVDLLNVFLAVGRQGSGRRAGKDRRSPYTHASVRALAKELGFDANTIKRAKMSSKFIPAKLTRSTPFLTQPVFNSYKNETDMLRYSQSIS